MSATNGDAHGAAEAHATPNPRRTAALAYAIAGYPVFPCNGKSPFTTHGVLDATTEVSQIHRWWELYPDANIGLRLGKLSGMFAIDVDYHPDHGVDGPETLRALEAQLGTLPDGPRQLTGSGGLHLLFKYPEGVDLGNSVGKLGPGLDTRSDNGYIIVAPSLHPDTGRPYVWEIDHALGEIPLPDLPPAWLDKLATFANNSANDNRSRAHVDETAGPIPKYRRNDTLLRNGGAMRSRGMGHTAIEAALLAENQARCQPPLDEAEVREIADSVAQYKPGVDPSGWEAFQEKLRNKAANGAATDPEEEEQAETEDGDSSLLVFPDLAWRGAFGAYRAAMQGTTEASDVFHFGALWAAAAVRLRRRVYLPYGMNLYPNVNLILYGPTGDRKTTAARGAIHVLEAAPAVKVLQGIGSGEGVADWLGTTEAGAQPPSHFLFLEELSELLTRGKWDGATLLPFLMRVFDCPARYEIIYRKNPIVLENPTLSSLSCTTPEVFWQYTRELDIRSGWVNRQLMLTGPRKAPIPLPAKPDLIQWGKVRAALARLDRLPEQEARLSSHAVELWKEFYAAWGQTTLESLVAAATERTPAYALKLALVYAALEETLPVIEEEQLTAAIAVARYGVQCAARLLNQQQQVSTQGRCEEAIRRSLRDAIRPLSRRVLWQRVGGRFDTFVFHRALEGLVRNDVVLAQPGKRLGQLYYSWVGRKSA